MKELLQSIFKTTEERVKNPFLGAFMTSWVIFNWKSILLIIFSSKSIEDKIKYVDVEYSNIRFLLWFPLLAAIFYILVMPYLTLLFDLLLRFSILKRNEIIIDKQKQNIENQKQLAIEEIKLEETKTSYRERNTHNRMVEELQKRNKMIEIELQSEKEKNSTTIEELKSELFSRDRIRNEELRNFERRYSESQKEISDLNNKLFEKDNQAQRLKMLLSDRVELNEKDRFRESLILFDNNLRIIERFDGNENIYLNPETKERYSEKEVKSLMEKHKFTRTKDLP